MHCVSEPCRNGWLGFAPGRRMSKTMRDPEGLPTRTFAMLFYASWRRIHILYLEIISKAFLTPKTIILQLLADLGLKFY
jgi:hypothetical protein